MTDWLHLKITRDRRIRYLIPLFLITGIWSGCSTNEPPKPLDQSVVVLLDDATVTQEAGFVELALAFVDSAIVLQPDHATPHYIRAQYLFQLNRLNEAEAAFNEVLKIDPEYQNAWFELGNIAFLRRDYSAAIAGYENEAEVLDASKRKYGNAFATRYNESMSEVALQTGRALKQLGEPEKAREAFTRSVSLDSLNTPAYADLSQAYQEAGLNDEALQYAQKALHQSPLNPDYLYQTGSLLYDTGRVKEAVPLLQGALQHKPWLSGAMYKLGLALISLEDEEAGNAYVQMADSLQAKNERIQKARFNAEKYAEEPERWVTLASQLLEVGRIDEAIEPLNTAYALDPENLAIQNDLATLALAGGDTAVAQVRLEKIVDQNPTFAEGWFNLGVIHAMQGNYKEARLHWENTIQLDPTHQEAIAYLARLEE